MTQIINLLNSLLPMLFYWQSVLLLSINMLNNIIQHLPKKMKWLYDVAQYIDTQQATHTNASGAEKKQAATDALLEQAKASKAKLTKETAEGMVEKAYQEGVKNEAK
ncbi:hypothetical protein JF76_11000 [Lactobacillus kullabergensis]|uniref:Uncharacterized protein n=1 Tax=Lactobacillus kullabergensis TaxID=1218493 RepID=A0A0F4LA37_9LACO|nr:hypothetical protein [Lactobacillus kullabergensis]KJY55460.1 hypothetical protein JF76_11000 [Lactobacillus kullabergensis]